ncbi:MAG: ATP-binding protein, partial [Sphaerochaetaceae bacterium]|nr:ATP-binding protein [Sphaerochaetaceae bacterium]
MELTLSKAVAIWDRALKEIKSQLNDRNVFEQFFGGTYVDKISESEIEICCDTALAQTVLENNFLKLIRSALKNDIDESVKLVFVCKDNVSEQKETQPQGGTFFSDSVVNRHYTFDNFIVGPSNKEAYQAALLIASNPGTMFNPLLIYSDSGLGKTHLLHAIGNSIHDKSPSSKVLYVTTQDFFDEYVRFVRGEQDGESLKAYFKRSVDVLLVDDIQFLVGNKASEIGIIVSAPVTSASISTTISATGSLEPVDQVEVGTQVSGDISKIYVDFNSKVKKGDIIA